MAIVAFSDANGDITRHPASDTWPLKTRSIATFTEQGGKTLLTIEWSPCHASVEENETFDAAHEGMTRGWGGSFDQLEAYLAETK